MIKPIIFWKWHWKKLLSANQVQIAAPSFQWNLSINDSTYVAVFKDSIFLSIVHWQKNRVKQLHLVFWVNLFHHSVFVKITLDLLKSSLFSKGHRGARKMNLFYYRGCENHDFKVPPKYIVKRFIFRAPLFRFWPLLKRSAFSNSWKRCIHN